MYMCMYVYTEKSLAQRPEKLYTINAELLKTYS